MAQKPQALNVTFTAEYAYDFSGNVLVVKNSAYKNQGGFNQFFHHYAYDPDLRLITVSTSTDGSTEKLRATYEYYRHGPLKRVELGNKLQGIDFVYNINGWLTQINHPDTEFDPGKDGDPGDHSGVKPDVFGMVLDYYESTMTGLYAAGGIKPGQDVDSFHKLPSTHNRTHLVGLLNFRPSHHYSDPSTPSKFRQNAAESLKALEVSEGKAKESDKRQINNK